MAAVAETCRHHLDCYGAYVYQHQPARHHSYWLDRIEQLIRGQSQTRRLLFIAPPGTAKSTWLSLIFPPWYLGNFPDHSLLFFTSSGEMAYQFSTTVKTTLEANERHGLVFPGTAARPNPERGWSSDGLYLAGTPDGSKDPAYRAVGYGAATIGARAHGIILDDPLTQEDARSATVQQRAKAYYDLTVDSRLQPDGWTIAIMTRWHERDLASHLMAKPEWETITLPALAGPSDPLGRPKGASIWPERFSVAWFELKRVSIGSAEFACAYQGNPKALESGPFKRHWFRQVAPPPEICRPVYQFWDTAYEEKTSADYSVCLTFSVEPSGYRLLDVWRERAEYPALKRIAVQLAQRFKPAAVVIEDKGSGKTLIQDLRNESRLPVMSYRPDRDKVSRAHAVTPIAESGRVLLPLEAPWLDAFLDEVTAFPVGRYDDQVDALTMALALMAVYSPSQQVQVSDFAISR